MQEDSLQLYQSMHAFIHQVYMHPYTNLRQQNCKLVQNINILIKTSPCPLAHYTDYFTVATINITGNYVVRKVFLFLQ